MQATVFCKTTAKGRQTFYVARGNKKYLLFTQDYRVSNKEFFRNGVPANELFNYSNVHSTAVKKTLDKLPSYIRFVEDEYGIAIFEKTKRAKKVQKKQKPYKREQFAWRQIDWEAA